MKIQENYSLKRLNTLGINASCRYFVEIGNTQELAELLSQDKYRNLIRLVLGGGSNILFTKDVDGIVIKNNFTGISLMKEDNDHYFVKAAAGENWHAFVMHCIRKGYAGIENLSLIPGCVGAGPMQNIGAYGVELKDVFHELEAWHIKDNSPRIFTHSECRFGYRDSIFKKEAKDKYVITSVTLRLNKKPDFNTSYGTIQEELAKMKISELSIEAISKAVISIRSSKLPDPDKIGNAGSFFKNPVVSHEKFQSLKKEFPGLVSYAAGTGMKLAAGWLIENCNWKGFREGDAGVHSQQALVLVNYGHAKGSEIYDLSCRIIESVEKKFGITLEREVNIL